MLSLKPHEYRINKDTGQATLTRLNPYVRLKFLEGDTPPIFIQGGVFMFEDGREIARDKLPDWAKAEVAKLSPQALKEVGLVNGKG